MADHVYVRIKFAWLICVCARVGGGREDSLIFVGEKDLFKKMSFLAQ